MTIHTVRRRLPGAALALAGLSVALPLLPFTRVGAQRPSPASDILAQQAATRVADAVCGKRVVLLGELPEHGEARGMSLKARIVERLVARCGFRAVLVEAGSYDFFGLERAIAATSRSANGRRAVADSGARADSLELALARAIGGLWWTRELAGWRRWLLREAVDGHVIVGGIDDQPSATAAYARATLPGLVGGAVPAARAAECAEGVGRYLSYRYTAVQPYDSAERARLADCTRLAADHAPGAGARADISAARGAERRTPDGVMLDDIASFFARERAPDERGGGAPPDRDMVMARHVAWWSARLPHDAKIVVWTATTHAARAGQQPPGVPTLGARLAERWGDQLAVVGFTALRGEWSRAGHPSQPLAPLPPDALEARALVPPVGDTAAWRYLDRAALRTLGPVPSRLLGKVVTIDWSTAFDGVVVVREETAPTFDPRR